MIVNGEYYLITTSQWFVANDGDEYRAVWGKCVLKETKETFGFTPLKPSTNWFCEVGEGENSVIVAGCQIHYAIKCNKRPTQKAGTFKQENTGIELVTNKIYFTE